MLVYRLPYLGVKGADIEGTLATVGLRGVEHKPVSAYSLGMRQRTIKAISDQYGLADIPVERIPNEDGIVYLPQGFTGYMAGESLMGHYRLDLWE